MQIKKFGAEKGETCVILWSQEEFFLYGKVVIQSFFSILNIWQEQNGNRFLYLQKYRR